MAHSYPARRRHCRHARAGQRSRRASRPTPTSSPGARQIAGTTGGSASYVVDPVEAVAGADVVATDTWVSMGKEGEADDRGSRRSCPTPLDAALLAHAAPTPIVLHCLPAYRGKEIAAEVIDGPQSVVWDEAENRLHAQKALLTWLLGAPRGSP